MTEHEERPCVDGDPGRPCVVEAWTRHEAPLRAWLGRQVRGDAAVADDLLQTVFLKVLRQGRAFCELRNPRAWLFATARHAVVDRYRAARREVPLPDDLVDDVLVVDPPPPVDAMSACLPRALEELGEQDAHILQRCDIEGQTQADYARAHGLSVPGAKSRLQRARRRLQKHLTEVCGVRRDEQGRVCCFVPRGPAEPPP